MHHCDVENRDVALPPFRGSRTFQPLRCSVWIAHLHFCYCAHPFGTYRKQQNAGYICQQILFYFTKAQRETGTEQCGTYEYYVFLCSPGLPVLHKVHRMYQVLARIWRSWSIKHQCMFHIKTATIATTLCSLCHNIFFYSIAIEPNLAILFL